MTSSTTQEDSNGTDPQASTTKPIHAMLVMVGGIAGFVAIPVIIHYLLSNAPFLTAWLGFVWAAPLFLLSFQQFDQVQYRIGAAATFALSFIGSAFVFTEAFADLFMESSIFPSADVFLAIIGIQRLAGLPATQKGLLLLAILVVYFEIIYSMNLRYWAGIRRIVGDGETDEGGEESLSYNSSQQV
jgi:signal transduction histidine kinase